MLLFAAIQRWLAKPSRTTSQPYGERNYTNTSVNQIMIKALALSLIPDTISSIKNLKMAISFRLTKSSKPKAVTAMRSAKTLPIALLLFYRNSSASSDALCLTCSFIASEESGGARLMRLWNLSPSSKLCSSRRTYSCMSWLRNWSWLSPLK